jgi:TonB family protein
LLTVQATIDAKGEVSDARVLSGPDELRKPALLSVFEWHYQPGPSQVLITIRFGEGAAASSTQVAPAADNVREAATKVGAKRGVTSGVTAPGVTAPGVTAPGLTSTATSAEPAKTLRAIEFRGLSPEAEQQIRDLLPVHEGDSIAQGDRDKVQAAVRGFDSHLNTSFVSFIVGGANDLTLRIGVPAAALTPAVNATGVYSPGNGVTNPVPTYHPDPQYTEEARNAKWQGAVMVSVVIDATGTPTNIKVVRPLGLGLDEKAIEAVQQWRFRPATKDGVPVSVQAQIDVTFRLQ